IFVNPLYADAGDVYCVYNIRLKQYTACQVTRVEEHGGKKNTCDPAGFGLAGQQTAWGGGAGGFETALQRLKE
ncbi:TPA: hypothetical protein ACFOAW_002132, partial [Neisseria meningitidis]